ncbi:MAG: hypothetical protein J4N26_01310 [Chloroflexi bacterium]|nr:hypothetical protein [Chloroflexota bacterium]
MTAFETDIARLTVPEDPPPLLAEDCPTCGAGLPEGSRFCNQCGRALGTTLAGAPGDVVTILFADLEGWTSFASGVGHEEVREVILGFHALVREQVGRHGGFEVKQMGDGFMIAFANPTRAVACAADIQRSMSAQYVPPGTRLVRVCVGINSGDAIREGDDFFGHTVNVASRIAGRADGGQVLVSEVTRVLAGHVEGARFVDIGRRRLRGLSGRIRLFEVVWED